MSKLMMIRKIISPLFFLNVVSGYRRKSALMKIKAAKFYVHGIGKLRVFYLGSIFVALAGILLVSGLFLIHMALFVYSTLSAQTKFITALSLGGLEFLGAISILFYLFREETWVKFTEIKAVLNAVIEDEEVKK